MLLKSKSQKTIFKYVFIIFLFLNGFLFCKSGFAKECLFDVSGYLKVKSQFYEFNGKTFPLKKVKVEVLGSTGAPWIWKSWGNTTSKKDGFFRIKKTKSGRACSEGRYIKVKVKFQGDDFEIRHAHSTRSIDKVKWYDIYLNKNKKHKPKSLVIDATFDANGNDQLNDFEARAHADIWMVYTKVVDYFSGLGSNYSFNKKFKIKYPHNSYRKDGEINENGNLKDNSFALDYLHIIYIVKNKETDHFQLDTLLHEIMHIWFFQHDKGYTHGNRFEDSHSDHTKTTQPAFHEGFAEFGAQHLAYILIGHEDYKPQPLNRYFLGVMKLNTIRDLTHQDNGWQNIFLTLTFNEPYRYDFFERDLSIEEWPILYSNENSVTRYLEWFPMLRRVSYRSPVECESLDLSFRDILKIFLEHPQKGYPNALSKEDMTWSGFFKRATHILNLNRDAVNQTKELINPSSTIKAFDLFCDVEIPEPLENDRNDCQKTYYRDFDKDGYGVAEDYIVSCIDRFGFVTNDQDCEDGDASVHPNTSEMCGDDLDNNCDGFIDENCEEEDIIENPDIENPMTQPEEEFDDENQFDEEDQFINNSQKNEETQSDINDSSDTNQSSNGCSLVLGGQKPRLFVFTNFIFGFCLVIFIRFLRYYVLF